MRVCNIALNKKKHVFFIQYNIEELQYCAGKKKRGLPSVLIPSAILGACNIALDKKKHVLWFLSTKKESWQYYT